MTDGRSQNINSSETALSKVSCGPCRAIGKLICPGHVILGGGAKVGSGVAGSGGSKPNESGVATASSYSAANSSSSSDNTFAHDTASVVNDWAQAIKSQAAGTTSIEAGLLSFESNNLRGILTLRELPGLSKEETECVKGYFSVIKLEFSAFKAKLESRGISTEKFSADSSKDNELIIKIPNPFYGDFIKQLASKNYLLSPFAVQLAKKEKVEIEDPILKKEKFSTPFAMPDISKGPSFNGKKIK